MITRIYDYITQNITYDYDKASDPPTGYTSDVDAILAPGWRSAMPRMPTMPGSVSTPLIPDG